MPTRTCSRESCVQPYSCTLRPGFVRCLKAGLWRACALFLCVAFYLRICKPAGPAEGDSQLRVSHCPAGLPFTTVGMHLIRPSKTVQLCNVKLPMSAWSSATMLPCCCSLAWSLQLSFGQVFAAAVDQEAGEAGSSALVSCAVHLATLALDLKCTARTGKRASTARLDKLAVEAVRKVTVSAPG